MSFLLHDHFDYAENYSPAAQTSSNEVKKTEREGVHILNEKLEIPRCRGLIDRPRLNEILQKSFGNVAAILVSGRAGTGKTAMAAEFARTRKHAAWYSVESSDIDWNVFAHYFAASVVRGTGSKKTVGGLLPDFREVSPTAIAAFLSNVICEAGTLPKRARLLIVLDGIHHLFDAPWFIEFFDLLLPSLSEKVDLLLLCRSKPPNPLWRMRSKQQLNVIDEKVLAFTRDEAVELFRQAGHSEWEAERLHTETFGRLSKLLPFVERGRSPKPKS